MISKIFQYFSISAKGGPIFGRGLTQAGKAGQISGRGWSNKKRLLLHGNLQFDGDEVMPVEK